MKIRKLSKKDVNLILELEEQSWPPHLQADEQTIRGRFQDEHIMLGVEVEKKLVAMLSFRYVAYLPADEEGFVHFPKSFAEFSAGKSINPGEIEISAFVYNFEVHPDFRATTTAISLLRSGLETIRKDGCLNWFGDARSISYKGTERTDAREPKASYDPDVKICLDCYQKEGLFLIEEKDLATILQDPIVGFYAKTVGGEPIWIISNFLPEDKVAGGFRIIVWGEIK